MALLAEEIVEEWLRRKGFFTIRGARQGVGETDLLAIRPTPDRLECRHIEVQASINAMTHFFPLARADQLATGRTALNAGPRTQEEGDRAVAAWYEKKYGDQRKIELLERLAPGPWTRELVVHKLRHPGDLDRLRALDLKVHTLNQILTELRERDTIVSRASGGDLVDLLLLARETTQNPGPGPLILHAMNDLPATPEPIPARVVTLFRYLAECAEARRTTTYREVADRVGGIPQGVGIMLARIAEVCSKHRWPRIDSLVVSQVTGEPGPGFILQGELAASEERRMQQIQRAQQDSYGVNNWSARIDTLPGAEAQDDVGRHADRGPGQNALEL